MKKESVSSLRSPVFHLTEVDSSGVFIGVRSDLLTVVTHFLYLQALPGGKSLIWMACFQGKQHQEGSGSGGVEFAADEANKTHQSLDYWLIVRRPCRLHLQ